MTPSTAWMRIRDYAVSLDGVLLFVVFISALIPRLWWACYEHPPLFSDMEDYYMSAIRFLRGEPLSMSPDRLAYRAPGYPLFLVFIINPFCGPPAAVQQALLGLLSAVLLYLITRRSLPKIRIHCHTVFSKCSNFCFLLHRPVFRIHGDQIFLPRFLTETLYVFVLLLWVYLGIRHRTVHRGADAVFIPARSRR